jgi:esterase/lipase superfamily enzyme
MDNLRFGRVRFDPAKARRLSDFDIHIERDLTETQMRDIGLLGEAVDRRKPPSRLLFEELHAAGNKAKTEAHILVFVHGFNNDLQGALTTMADLHKLYVEPKDSPVERIVMFTWPARGELQKYRDDARDAVKSGYAMARSFQLMTGFFHDLIMEAYKERKDPEKALCGQKIHLMCHSMGNRVFESMLDELQRKGIRPHSVFGEILLMAADVDDDSMAPGKALSTAIQLGERVHVYYHNGDQALGISERTKNAFNRLGRWGVRRTIELPDDVYQADVTYINDVKNLRERAGNHWYYLHSPSVVRDVIEVLNGKVTTFNY